MDYLEDTRKYFYRSFFFFFLPISAAIGVIISLIFIKNTGAYNQIGFAAYIGPIILGVVGLAGLIFSIFFVIKQYKKYFLGQN